MSEYRDKDLLHMALYDLYVELKKENLKLDDTSLKQLVDKVLKLLDDKQSEVQGMAVKCMGQLVTKMNKFQVENVVCKLCQRLLKGDDEKRDIATIGLKEVISKAPISIAFGAVKKSLPLLVLSFEQEIPEIKLDALDVLDVILRRFGSLISSHSILQKVFMNELGNSQAAVRKRATTALALLSQHTSMNLFNSLTDSIIFNIRSSLEQGGIVLRTYILLTSQVAKYSGHRIGRKVDEFIDLLLRTAETCDQEEEEGENDVIRKYIMQALESFVLKCRNEVTVFVELILIICCEYLEYDPSFSYESTDEETEGEENGDNDDDDKEEEEEEEEEDGETESSDSDDDDDDDYSDDDGISFKVRKAASRCLLALIKVKPDLLGMMYMYLCSDEEHTLLSRFKEREESVKLEIFKVFEALLGQTCTVMTREEEEEKIIIIQQKEIDYLKNGKKMIVGRILKQINHPSPRVKHAVFSALKELVFTMQGGFEDYIDVFIKHSKKVVKQNYTALKLVNLEFLQILLDMHSPDCFKNCLETLIETVYNQIDDKYYKISAKTIKVCYSLVPLIKDFGDIEKIRSLFKVVYTKLMIQDLELGIEENAIKTMTYILSSFGKTELTNELKQCLPLLLKKLKNETTRLLTCKCFGGIADSEEKVDLSTEVIVQIISELSSFLKVNDRELRKAALSSLIIMVNKYNDHHKFVNEEEINMIQELSKLLVIDQDLHLVHLSLTLAHCILRTNPSTIKIIEQYVLPRILELLTTNTLQGEALESLILVLKGIIPTIGYETMIELILSSMKKGEEEEEEISKQVFINISHSISEVGYEKDQKETISRFQKELMNSEQLDQKMLALFIIGEIGRKINLSSNTEVIQQIQSNFDSSYDEDINIAASYSLGNISLGNLEHFLPQILSQITHEKNQEKMYLFIHSLKEIIVRSERDKLLPHTEQITPLLFQHSDNLEERVRNVVSECLGKLCLQFYEEIMPQLKNHVSTGTKTKSRGKVTIISAVKYMIINAENEKPLEIDEALKKDLPLFLSKLNKQKEKVDVRRSSILLLTSVVHSKPSLIITQLGKIIPRVYIECEFEKIYQRVFTINHFKHNVDDGLELRKSAFECLYTLLISAVLRDQLVGIDFVKRLKYGFQDGNNDIKLLAHKITIKCCLFFPIELIQIIGKCCVDMRKLLKKRMRYSVPQQEIQRHEKMLKSTLKVIYSISKLKGSSDILKFTELVEIVIPNQQILKNFYQQIKSEEE